jgi:hypothetical protein
MHKVLEPHKRAALESVEHVFTEDKGISQWKQTWPVVKSQMIAAVAVDIAQGHIVGLQIRDGETQMFTIKLKRKFKKPTL